MDNKKRDTSRAGVERAIATALHPDMVPNTTFVKVVRCTSQLKDYLIREILVPQKINYIVAPFEADSQLVCMVRAQILRAVLSVDSDFIVHGCSMTLLTSKHVKFPNAELWSAQAIVSATDRQIAQSPTRVGKDLLLAIREHGLGVLQVWACMSKCDYIDRFGWGSARASDWIKAAGAGWNDAAKINAALYPWDQIRVSVNGPYRILVQRYARVEACV